MSRALKIIGGIAGLVGTLIACDIAAKGWAGLLADGLFPADDQPATPADDQPATPSVDTPAAE